MFPKSVNHRLEFDLTILNFFGFVVWVKIVITQKKKSLILCYITIKLIKSFQNVNRNSDDAYSQLLKIIIYNLITTR